MKQLQLKEQDEKAEYRIEIKQDSNQLEIAVYCPYDPTGASQRICKSITGYRFNSNDKSWRYPPESIVEILAKFPEPKYCWQDERLKELNQQEQARRKVAAAEQEKEAAKRKKQRQKQQKIFKRAVKQQQPKIGEPLANGSQLRDYQIKAVKWLLNRHQGGEYPGAILADDMGLGKTIEALAAAKLLHNFYQCQIVVICPVSLIENWQREAEKVGVPITSYSHHHRKIPQPLVSSPYIVIVDEAHCFQNEKAARTKKLTELIAQQNCLAAWLLSGTPIKNGSPINLFPLLVICEHELADDRQYYINRYCDPTRRNFGSRSVLDITGATNLAELKAETEDVILRRTKQECLPELPEKMRLYREIELTNKETKAYKQQFKQLLADYHRRVKLGKVDSGAEALVTLNYLRKLNSQFKLPTAITLVEELLEQGQQVVIFCEFIESAQSLYKTFKSVGELLIGSTKDRQGAVDRFQNGASKVFIGTTKAGGVGVTLTAASNVILVDRPWTPGDAEQAEDRCYRLGQENAVFANWLRLGAIDEQIDNLLIEKQHNIDLVLTGKTKTKEIQSLNEFAKKLIKSL